MTAYTVNGRPTSKNKGGQETKQSPYNKVFATNYFSFSISKPSKPMQLFHPTTSNFRRGSALTKLLWVGHQYFVDVAYWKIAQYLVCLHQKLVLPMSPPIFTAEPELVRNDTIQCTTAWGQFATGSDSMCATLCRRCNAAFGWSTFSLVSLKVCLKSATRTSQCELSLHCLAFNRFKVK